MDIEEIKNLICLSSVGSVEASLKLSDYYLEIGEFSKAFDVVNRLSLLENADILRRLGYFYQNGIYVEKNASKALEYYLKASNLGDCISDYNIAIIYYQNKKYNEAIKYLTSGQINDHINSIKMLADMYYQGLGVCKNLEIAENLYLRLIKIGDNSAYYKLSKIKEEKGDILTASTYLENAYNYGDLRSYYDLAVKYLTGNGVIKNVQKAILVLEQGAKQNDTKCIKQLKLLYENGIAVKKNISKSNELIDGLWINKD